MLTQPPSKSQGELFAINKKLFTIYGKPSNFRRIADFACLLPTAHGEWRPVLISVEAEETWRVWAGRKMM